MPLLRCVDFGSSWAEQDRGSCPFISVLDIYPFYGSDAEAALRAGGDYRIGLLGPGVDASHSFERTHRDGLLASTQLLLAYLLDEG